MWPQSIFTHTNVLSSTGEVLKMLEEENVSLIDVEPVALDSM